VPPVSAGPMDAHPHTSVGANRVRFRGFRGLTPAPQAEWRTLAQNSGVPVCTVSEIKGAKVLPPMDLLGSGHLLRQLGVVT
jgi:hypothetical protein